MTEELLPYYERELTFMRQMAGEFKEKYPKIAGRLRLESEKEAGDPHIERLIEAFALLAGRIHRKLDDEFPEITEALLDALYPHLLRPIPSLAIAQFQTDPAQTAPVTTQVPVGTPITGRTAEGQLCYFRTCYPVTVGPLKVMQASVSATNAFVSPEHSFDTAATIRIQVGCPAGLNLHALPLQRLRFYLNGETAAVHNLYEFLFLSALRIHIRALPATTAELTLSAECIQQVGFNAQEKVIPYSDRSFVGYSLLQEYFSFPDKFLFFDLVGVDRLPKSQSATGLEIVISLKAPEQPYRLTALEQAVSATTFQLGCTPIINLFERIAEPIRINQTKSEYRVVPDQHNQSSTEVYSVDDVSSTGTYPDEPQVYRAFYDLRHIEQDEHPEHFWYTHRRASLRKNDNGTDVYISLVDLDFKPVAPPTEVLSLRVTCTNRDEAPRLKITGEFGELDAEGMALLQTRCLRAPTATLRPPMRKGLQWQLISNLSLNFLSIVEKGKEPLQELLLLYDLSKNPTVRKQISGISSVTSSSSVTRVHSHTGITFCRGTDVTIEFDEQQYVGTGIVLLSSVLNQFFGLYSAINSFSRLTVKTKKGVVKRWPPLLGEQILL